jgi:UDP-N-acetylglucosamine 1-carboxyvinyltransferase
LSSLIVRGGKPLSGEIRPSGNKNAALPMLCAAVLTDEPVVIHNVPSIKDVLTLVDLLRAMGAAVTWPEPNTIRIDASGVNEGELPYAEASRIRGSLLLAGPMLARCGRVVLPPPGGDVIGRRRVDTHVMALEALGATFHINGGYDIEARGGLKGANVFLDEPSVTGTENAVMAAVMAKGTTILRNAAAEPHVQDLCNMLVGMGAQIDGIGTGRLTIEGVERLHGGEFRVGSDHIEIGSFIGLAAVTGGELLIRDAAVEHLDSTLIGFRRLGVECRIQGEDLLVPADQEMVIRTDIGGHTPKVDDGPWPAFPADLTSIAVVTATQCRGNVLIHEKMFESRMFFVDKLIAMGASIVLCDPHRVVVSGKSALTGGTVSSPDIRAGMALLLAALCTDGKSRIENAGQIDRGYERIEERLRALGAGIERAD